MMYRSLHNGTELSLGSTSEPALPRRSHLRLVTELDRVAPAEELERRPIPATANPNVICFADCELDLACFSLKRGGVEQRVEPKVFDLIACLVKNANRVVLKSELFETLWKGEVVGDSALTQCVFAARRVLGDNGREKRIIATASKRGYRFIAPLGDATNTPASGAYSTFHRDE